MPSKRRTTAPKPLPAGPTVYQLKITLHGSKPAIWRRVLVEPDTTLAQLHDIIQVVFAWEDMHLHMYEFGDAVVGDTSHPEDESHYDADERNVRLEQLQMPSGCWFLYTYDFGDSWTHRVEFQREVERKPGVDYPRCTAGRMQAPPEDCGGLWGYYDMLRTLEDPDDPDYEDIVEWLGVDELDPTDFDYRTADALLGRLRPSGDKRETGD